MHILIALFIIGPYVLPSLAESTNRAGPTPVQNPSVLPTASSSSPGHLTRAGSRTDPIPENPRTKNDWRDYLKALCCIKYPTCCGSVAVLSDDTEDSNQVQETAVPEPATVQPADEQPTSEQSTNEQLMNERLLEEFQAIERIAAAQPVHQPFNRLPTITEAEEEISEEEDEVIELSQEAEELEALLPKTRPPLVRKPRVRRRLSKKIKL